MPYIFIPEKISLKMAKSKIAAYAKYTNHKHDFRPKTSIEVEKLLRGLGYDPNKFADQCRDYRKPVPSFENLLGSRWKTSGNISIIDKTTLETIGNVKGQGEISLSPYQSNLEDAFLARDLAIKESSFTAMKNMAMHGIGAIEAFFALLAYHWNKKHPDDQLIDSKENKVSLLDKFDLWVPKMMPSAKVPKNNKSWNDFRYILSIRDSHAHPKINNVGVTIEELAKGINAYKYGIGLHMINMHITFRYFLPSVLINSYYFPDVVVHKGSK